MLHVKLLEYSIQEELAAGNQASMMGGAAVMPRAAGEQGDTGSSRELLGLGQLAKTSLLAQDLPVPWDKLILLILMPCYTLGC